jgi:hypothetical protein
LQLRLWASEFKAPEVELPLLDGWVISVTLPSLLHCPPQWSQDSNEIKPCRIAPATTDTRFTSVLPLLLLLVLLVYTVLSPVPRAHQAVRCQLLWSFTVTGDTLPSISSVMAWGQENVERLYSQTEKELAQK